MRQTAVVGIRPWLPWPLSRWPWWTEPVRAERLAAVRIAVALVLLVDLLLTYLPHVADFYGRDSLGSPPLFDYLRKPPRWQWSFLAGVEDAHVLQTALVTLILATVSLLLGACTRLSAALVWLLSNSFATLNCYVENAGDDVRNILLFYLLLSPSGAAWSVDRWLRRRWGEGAAAVFVHPWMLRLMFVQMAFIYFANGMYKFMGRDWPGGESLYYVLADMTLTRWSYAQFPVPYWLTQWVTWTVLYWEMAFPLLMLLPWLVDGMLRPLPMPFGVRELLVSLLRYVRIITLLFGVLFHLGILATMEIGFFPVYMLGFYVPLLPWERWADRGRPPEDVAEGVELVAA